MTIEGIKRRGRSPHKRLAILDAAQQLFLADGYDLTSVDAIAARAEVSKRTVYDHFGDKQQVHAAVVERVGQSLLATVRVAIDEHLSPGCDLEVGLLAFARRVATEAFSSSTYVELRNLGYRGRSSSGVPQVTRNAPREILMERMAGFAAAGVIKTDHPRRATEHFVALTFLLASDTLERAASSSQDDVDDLLADGVRAFLRIYT